MRAYHSDVIVTRDHDICSIVALSDSLYHSTFHFMLVLALGIRQGSRHTFTSCNMNH